MPCSLPDTPRKIFPPPTTTTTCTPSSRTSRICSAMWRTAWGQMPTPFSPPSASPLSLSRIRENFGFLTVVIKLEARGTSWTIFNSRRTTRQIKAAAKIKKCILTPSSERGCVPQSGTSRSRFAKPACWNPSNAAELFHVLRLVLCTQPRSKLVAFGAGARMHPIKKGGRMDALVILNFRSGAFADLKPHEPANADFVAELLGNLRRVFLQADLGVPLHKTLIHEAISLVKFLQFAFDDFGNGLRRFVLHLLGGDFLFLRHHVRRHLLARNHVRMSRRDLKRDVLDELLEFLFGRGFRLARADFDEHADLCAGVNIAGDEPVAVDFHPRVPGDFDVLADFRDERLALGFQTGIGIGGQPARKSE